MEDYCETCLEVECKCSINSFLMEKQLRHVLMLSVKLSDEDMKALEDYSQSFLKHIEELETEIERVEIELSEEQIKNQLLEAKLAEKDRIIEALVDEVYHYDLGICQGHEEKALTKEQILKDARFRALIQEGLNWNDSMSIEEWREWLKSRKKKN